MTSTGLSDSPYLNAKEQPSPALQLGPIVGVEIYRRDVVVIREGTAPDCQNKVRSEIWHFSRKSRQRLAFVAANTDVTFVTMITLTYPREFPGDGRLVKNQLNTFIQFLRRQCHNPYYLWCLEFQTRGAPHVHLVIDWPLPSRKDDTSAFRWRVACAWYRIVGSQDERHLAAGTRTERIRKVDGAARYFVKYAAKMKQKTVPPAYRNVGRFWACSRAVMPLPRRQAACTEDDLRGRLEGWEYAPAEDRALYRVLYGVADRF